MSTSWSGHETMVMVARRLVETYVDTEIVSVWLCLTLVVDGRCHYKANKHTHTDTGTDTDTVNYSGKCHICQTM